MKIATIGSGSIVDKFIEGMGLAQISLYAVYSRTETKAKSFADKHKASKYYFDIDKMFADKDFDTVYVASPNSLHFSYAIKALNAGKNVIVEKPFTSTLKESQELFDLAQSKNLFVFEAITTIHLPNYQLIKNNLSALGNIKLLTLNFSQFSSRYLDFMAGKQTNVFDPKFSGGALADINVYNIHFTVGLFGKPNSYKYYPNITSGIDTSGVMILNYDGFTVSAIAAKDSTSDYLFYIQGDKGTIKISGASCGVCKSVELFLLDNDKNSDGIEKFKGFSMEQGYRSIGIDQKQHLFYEISDFEKIINQKDLASYEKLKTQTLTVMEIMYKARLEACAQVL
jgi:predicted dehydrogenase